MELFHAYTKEELSSLRPMILLGEEIRTGDVNQYVKCGTKESNLVTNTVRMLSHERDFDDLVETHAQERTKLSHEQEKKEIIELAEKEQYFNKHLNFAPGDYV